MEFLHICVIGLWVMMIVASILQYLEDTSKFVFWIIAPLLVGIASATVLTGAMYPAYLYLVDAISGGTFFGIIVWAKTTSHK
jgi:hypothetical protein